MRETPLTRKSFQIAVDVVRLCRSQSLSREWVLTRQLLRSGTSVGANVEEATQGQSRADFVSKLSISLKEAYETRYWLRLMGITFPEIGLQCRDLHVRIDEMIRLLVSSIKTAKSHM